MKFKKLLIVFSITLTIIMSLTFGASYAWYAYSNAETLVSGTTKKEIPTTIFSQTEFISSSHTMPIYDEDRYNYANKNSFTITIGENLKNYETAIEISLKDIKIAEELKINNYKYELLEDGVSISQGNFGNIAEEDTLIIMPMKRLTPYTYPNTYTYELYIWLSENESDQNNLMNKEFSARINVDSAMKKK